MTHRGDNKAFSQVLEVLIENGLEGMAMAMEVIFNEAMKIEREGFLQAKSHERTQERRGYANGYKDKRVRSRLGELGLRIPQVRGLSEGEAGFYPRSLEKGLRSERSRGAHNKHPVWNRRLPGDRVMCSRSGGYNPPI